MTKKLYAPHIYTDNVIYFVHIKNRIVKKYSRVSRNMIWNFTCLFDPQNVIVTTLKITNIIITIIYKWLLYKQHVYCALRKRLQA